MKTNELSGAALNWAVAKCEPDDTLAIYFDEDTGEPLCHDDWEGNQEYKPSTDWAQGGPIIERANIAITGTNFPWWECDDGWYAHIGDCYSYGTTPLIAAMRCYVASKLGDEVKLPEGLSC
jgi:hypothetical protein